MHAVDIAISRLLDIPWEHHWYLTNYLLDCWEYQVKNDVRRRKRAALHTNKTIFCGEMPSASWTLSNHNYDYVVGQGFLMAYDNTLREGYGDGTSSIVSSMPRTTSINGEVTDHHNISNNVGNDASSKSNPNSSQQKVRMVQFQRNTAEPLVCF